MKDINIGKAVLLMVIILVAVFLEITYMDKAISKFIFYSCMIILNIVGIRMLCYDKTER